MSVLAEVIIYTKPGCPFCAEAKELLDRKNAAFQEINAVDKNGAHYKEMVARSNGAATYPQIFINGKHIGGRDALYKLEDEGKLDGLLAEPPSVGGAKTQATIGDAINRPVARSSSNPLVRVWHAIFG